MIKPEHFKWEVIIPTLEKYNLFSESACQLLLCTAAQETLLGYFLKQKNGPAVGIYQIEPNTLDDLRDNWLIYRPEYSHLALWLENAEERNRKIICQLDFATIIARLQYRRFAEPLPKPGDLENMARYWKKYWNTRAGKGTEEEFISHSRQLIPKELRR